MSADAARAKLILYLKDELNFGAEKHAGLDVLARLVADGVCAGIKYAVVRDDPTSDAYLAALLERVDSRFVISGIGERPAVVHLRDWKLPGFTTGSGCLAPHLSQQIFESCERGDFAQAENIRGAFLPLEDSRDAWGPARVLHAAVEQVGMSRMGAIPPFVSELRDDQRNELAAIARWLFAADTSSSEPRAVASG
jgi:dihydrodipicolinate synthase/N-acetylneuraminate lyase